MAGQTGGDQTAAKMHTDGRRRSNVPGKQEGTGPSRTGYRESQQGRIGGPAAERFQEALLKVSVLKREVAMARELVEEKGLELEEWQLKNTFRNEVLRDLQKTVSKWQGTSEALKKELSVLTKREEELAKELLSGQEKALKKELLLLTR